MPKRTSVLNSRDADTTNDPNAQAGETATEPEDTNTSGAAAVEGDDKKGPNAAGEQPVVVDDPDATLFPDDPDDPDEGEEVVNDLVDGAANGPDQSVTESDQAAERLTGTQVAALNRKYGDTGIRFGSDGMDAMVERISTLTKDKTALRARVKALEADAAAGKEYRTDLIEQTMNDAKRAHPGDAATFDEDGLRDRLTRTTTSVDDLKFWRGQYKAQGDARFARDSGGPRLLPVHDDDDLATGGRKKGRKSLLVNHAD